MHPEARKRGKVTVLGTGTSTGVPIPLCTCGVCKSLNPKNQRQRVSVYISLEDSIAEASQFGLLIDTTPDFRSQALRFEIPRIDAVLITHTHADHIFGMDDLRGFNFAQKTKIPVFATRQSADVLQSIFGYCFTFDPSYEGGAPPSLELREFSVDSPLLLGSASILPLPALHGTMPICGFRVGSFAYLTDCSHIPEETLESMHGLDTLILDALRYRSHPTHLTLDQAVSVVEKIKPKTTYLTHLSHDVEYEEGCAYLRKKSTQHIELAYDGLECAFEY